MKLYQPLFIAMTMMVIPLTSVAQFDVSNFELSDSTTQWYDQLVGVKNIGVINGGGYQFDIRSSTSHPFLEGHKQMEQGEIIYHDDLYQDIPLIYNVFDQNLISSIQYEDNMGTQYVLFNQEQVVKFSFGDHLFERIDDLQMGLKGYYEVYHQDVDYKFIAKHTKQKNINQGKVKYMSYSFYYFLMGKDLKKVKTRLGVSRFFKSNKSDLSKYYKENAFPFWMLKASTNQLKDLGRFCNSFTHQ